MVRCVVIVIGMRYKVEFLNRITNRWCFVVITETELLTGQIESQIKEKHATPVFDIYKIEAITD